VLITMAESNSVSPNDLFGLGLNILFGLDLNIFRRHCGRRKLQHHYFDFAGSKTSAGNGHAEADDLR
jgi:hypothetical protein